MSEKDDSEELIHDGHATNMSLLRHLRSNLAVAANSDPAKGTGDESREDVEQRPPLTFQQRYLLSLKAGVTPIRNLSDRRGVHRASSREILRRMRGQPPPACSQPGGGEGRSGVLRSRGASQAQGPPSAPTATESPHLTMRLSK